ncbi:MAG TPA: hypothetical protein VGR94_05380 [Candidatus Acidoferrales bacterium]|nr:hypothetical protein [Candidatus Acidoferrales bacterium]
MKVAFVACVLAFSGLTMAQTVQRTQEMNQAVMAEQILTADGHIYLTVKNNSGVAITAMAVTATKTAMDGTSRRPGQSVRYFDSIVNPFGPAGRSISPGESYRFSLAGPLEKREVEARLRAVIFADGSTTGEADWIQRLIHSRTTDLYYVDQDLQILQNGKANSEPTDMMGQRAQSLSDSVFHSSASTEDKQIAMGLCHEILMYINGHFDQAAAPDQRVENAISQLLTRRQRLLLSKPKLDETGPVPSGS